LNDERGWRLFAGATMLLLFFGVLIFVAVFDAFLTRFLPIFLGLLCVALIAWSAVALILRTVQRIRRHPPHPDEREPPR
jgi:membrane protein implicated in regulation of membrane protease activity